MLVTEKITINGKSFTKTYSDAGMKVERDGVKYDEAIDLSKHKRKYTETNEPIEQ